MKPRYVTFVFVLICTALAGAQSQSSSTAARTTSSDAVVATVGDRVIRMSDLEQHWKEQDAGAYARMRQEAYDANRQMLDDLVNEYLLQNEAKKRNLTDNQLLDAEAPKHLPPITEERMRALYAQSREAAQGVPFESLQPAIQAYLEQRQPMEARERYLEELRKAAKDVTIRLEIPRQPIDVLPNDPVSGPATAKVQIVEFSDFQCPFCKQVVPVLKQLAAKYPDQVKIVWKDFPLPSHPFARPAAEAAQCAREQGKFWEYHDKLFGNQSLMTSDNLKQWAGEMGMDSAKFNACFDSGGERKLVQDDADEGSRNGVASTPTVFINGRAVVGAMPIDAYDAIIQEELARK